MYPVNVPRRTKAESEATAAAIVRAARRLYAERGFAGVAVEEVAAAAGVTRGAVYHHFSSRRGLFAAVHADVQRSVADAVAAATDGLTDPAEGLVVGSRTFLAASAADDARQVVLVDGPAVLGWSQWRAGDAEHSARLLEEVLGELHSAGRLGLPSVAAAAALLSGAMNEVALWVAGSADRERASAEAWETLHALLRAVVRPASAA